MAASKETTIRKPKQIKQPCIYCGQIRGRISGEHVIPEAIGGREEIRPVCTICNGGELSKLDTELCSRSPLSIVAAAELQDQRSIHEIWAIDEQQSKLLIEGQWDPIANLFLAYPQLIIEGERSQLRGDGEEILNVGVEQFKKVFVEGAMLAYKEHTPKKPRLMFEEVDRRFFPSDNRLPPRIFSRHRLPDLKVGSTFVLRYVDEADKRHLLDQLSKGAIFKPSTKEASKPEYYRAGQTLAFQTMVSPVKIGRAFMKIGLNALKWALDKTTVDLNTFPNAFGLVTGERVDNVAVESENGFVRAQDLTTMDCQPNEHRIWIMREGNRWIVKVAFFGGRLGGKASIPGPSAEEWMFADIRCPIGGPMQLVRKSTLYVAGDVPIQNKNFGEIAPSIAAHNTREGKFFVPKKLPRKK